MYAPEAFVIVTPETLLFILIAGPPGFPALSAADGLVVLTFVVPPPAPPFPIILPLFTIVQGMSIVRAAIEVSSDQIHKDDGIVSCPPELI
jgi:hypothetical protein